MIKFYTNRELSQTFRINLAKWKRWSREFLPPDPLGGLQSGYARQYNLNEAFRVFLGGHLVGALKYTIPDTRQILNDLHQWLTAHGFYFDFSEIADPTLTSKHLDRNYHIAIINREISIDRVAGFSYWIKATHSVESVDLGDNQIRQERIQESSIGPSGDTPALSGVDSYCVLNISVLRRNFLNCLQKIA